jgi:hypothetical protein
MKNYRNEGIGRGLCLGAALALLTILGVTQLGQPVPRHWLRESRPLIEAVLSANRCCRG